MFTCGKCRIQNVVEAKRCTTIEMVRAHYAASKPAVKRPKKVQAKA